MDNIIKTEETEEAEEKRIDDIILYYRLLKYGIMSLIDEEEFKDYIKQFSELKKNIGDKNE